VTVTLHKLDHAEHHEAEGNEGSEGMEHGNGEQDVVHDLVSLDND
jgi:hypothetical protein